MRDPLLVPDLRELLLAGETAALREFLEDHHPAKIAEIVEDLGEAEGEGLFRLLDARVQAEALSYFNRDAQARLIDRAGPDAAAELLRVMSHDERADLVARLDDETLDRILPKLARAEREDIRKLAAYEPGTAGAAMTTDYATLAPTQTVREALDRLRREAPDRETIYYTYVIDSERKLIGIVSLKTLILANPKATIEEIMTRDVIAARVDENQESVAKTIDKYDLIAIPVVDSANMLVGIVTHDDAIDILRREQTEDMLAFGGVSADADRTDEESYWKGGVRSAVRDRLAWLSLLYLGGTLTSFVIGRFQDVDGLARQKGIDLDVFIPLVIGTGGNAGSQTVGTVIRGLALGEIVRKDAARVVLREWLTGLSLGGLLGVMGFIYTCFALRHPARYSLVVALSTFGICIWANTVGAVIPLLARKFGVDPAVVSAPLISTLVDATGLIIYYRIAMIFIVSS